MASNSFSKISEQRVLPIEISPVDVILTEGEDNDIASPTDSSSGSATNSRPSQGSPSSAKGKGVSFAPILVASNNISRDSPQDVLGNNISELREELSQVHIDLSAEKAIRKKKDKSLFKLAKQLAVQTEEIGQMEKYIRELQQEIATLQEANTKAREVNDAFMLKFCSSNYEKDVLNISQIKPLLDQEVMRHPIQHDSTNGELQSSSNAIEGHSSSTTQISPTSTITTPPFIIVSMSKLYFFTLLLFGAVHFFVLFIVLYSGESFSLSNAICAPAHPGTTLNNLRKNVTMESPWVAPQRFKRMAHAILCHNTPNTRTILRWDAFNRTLAVEQISTDNSSFILWKKEYSHVQLCTISSNGIRVQLKTTRNTNTAIQDKKAKYCTDDDVLVKHTTVQTINGPWRQFL